MRAFCDAAVIFFKICMRNIINIYRKCMESHKFFGKYLCHNMEAISTRKPKKQKKIGIKIFIYCRPKIDKGQMDLVLRFAMYVDYGAI